MHTEKFLNSNVSRNADILYSRRSLVEEQITLSDTCFSWACFLSVFNLRKPGMTARRRTQEAMVHEK